MSLSKHNRTEGTVRVLIVDDSPTVRGVLSEILQSHPNIEVVAAAADPYEARQLIKQHNPDVLTLDIEMPKMDGITFLKNLMRLRPMPVVMVSTLTLAGAPATLEALELGAVDFVAKSSAAGQSLVSQREEIVEKVLAAAGSNMEWRAGSSAESRAGKPPRLASSLSPRRFDSRYLCAIGASTGGVEAIKEVLVQLPTESPPIVITQHIPALFSASFAQRLNRICAIEVCEAEQGQPIKAGCAYLAPGDKHLRVEKSARGYVCVIDDSPPVNRHKPSVEVLYRSVLAAAGPYALPILLTGMGNDGARALLEMRKAGCTTVAQSEETCVVWGMPGAAVSIQAVSRILPLDKIAKFILHNGDSLRSR